MNASKIQLPAARLPLLPPAATVETKPCPICALPWTRSVGSALPCHARCLYAPDAVDELRRIARETSHTVDQLAGAAGISRQAFEGIVGIGSRGGRRSSRLAS